MHRRLVTLLALAAAACGAPQGDPATAAPPHPDPEPAPLRPGPETMTPEVTRAGLEALLGAGPGHFFGVVEVEGVGGDDGEGFVGWSLVSLPAGTPAWLDVQPGDVVTALNGMPVERPEQVRQIYEALRVASEVRIDLLRDGSPRSVRVPIVDDDGPPPGPDPPAGEDDAD